MPDDPLGFDRDPGKIGETERALDALADGLDAQGRVRLEAVRVVARQLDRISSEGPVAGGESCAGLARELRAALSELGGQSNAARLVAQALADGE